MKIIQLSDTHLWADPQREHNGVKPYQTLSRIIEHIKTLSLLPHLILLTGDLSEDDSKESYQHLAQLIESLHIPCHFIPGNHDVKKILFENLHGKNIFAEKIIDTDGWRIILLDSVIEGEVSGYLVESELFFLQEALRKNDKRSVMVGLHHHPLAVSKLMDRYILRNSKEFINVLQKFPQVKTVIFGHVHQAFEKQHERICFLGCPSTWVQLMPEANTLAFDPIGPGYRWLTLSADKFETGIVRVL